MSLVVGTVTATGHGAITGNNPVPNILLALIEQPYAGVTKRVAGIKALQCHATAATVNRAQSNAPTSRPSPACAPRHLLGQAHAPRRHAARAQHRPTRQAHQGQTAVVRRADHTVPEGGRAAAATLIAQPQTLPAGQ